MRVSAINLSGRGHHRQDSESETVSAHRASLPVGEDAAVKAEQSVSDNWSSDVLIDHLLLAQINNWSAAAEGTSLSDPLAELYLCRFLRRVCHPEYAADTIIIQENELRLQVIRNLNDMKG